MAISTPNGTLTPKELARARRVLLCVSGSIAAYKAADLVSLLVKAGCEVQCLMTESASQFITPVVLETLSRNPVQSLLFGPGVSGTEHIRLARWADVMVFAPATAHLLAKLSLGLADDLITTVALATRAPLLIAPAMNTVMWEQPVVRSHLAALSARGATFVEPDSGTLACGEEGAGKLATPEKIARAILDLPLELALKLPLEANTLSRRPKNLAGQTLLITAGSTRSHIDAVRYITNPSTGRMGAALAHEALLRGAEVRYILGIDKGVVRPETPEGSKFKLIEVLTAEEMRDAALRELPDCTGVIATAAVLDYRVEVSTAGKQKRAQEPLSLRLVPSADVLQSLRDAAHADQWFLGFAAETDDVEKNGEAKLAKKRLNFLFANPVAHQNEKLKTGFGTDTNSGTLFRKNAPPLVFGLCSKAMLASEIWDHVPHETAKAHDHSQDTR